MTTFKLYHLTIKAAGRTGIIGVCASTAEAAGAIAAELLTQQGYQDIKLSVLDTIHTHKWTPGATLIYGLA